MAKINKKELHKDYKENAEFCYWCGKKLGDIVEYEEFLTPVFGYFFCNKKCIEAYIDSK